MDDGWRAVAEILVIFLFVRKVSSVVSQYGSSLSQNGYLYDIIITKGYFRVIAMITVDSMMIASNAVNLGKFSKILRILGNVIKLTLLLADYLDHTLTIKPSVSSPKSEHIALPIPRAQSLNVTQLELKCPPKAAVALV
jgi:hypothetical protein